MLDFKMFAEYENANQYRKVVVENAIKQMFHYKQDASTLKISIWEYLHAYTSFEEQQLLFARLGMCRCCERHQSCVPITLGGVLTPPAPTAHRNCSCSCRHFRRILSRGYIDEEENECRIDRKRACILESRKRRREVNTNA